MKNKITDIFFDLDHTLWDFDRNSALTFQKIFKINNINLNVSRFLKHYAPINLNYWKLYREEKIDKKSLRFARLNDTFQAVGFSISKDLINKLSEDYITHLSDFNHLFEHTFEILDYLKGKYQLHIITNGFEEIQTKKMETSKILHYFDIIVTSESVGVKKPNPKVFNFALEKANAINSASIMIGDSIEADVEGALSVGMKAIHANFEKGKVNNVNFNSITSLLDIKEYL